MRLAVVHGEVWARLLLPIVLEIVLGCVECLDEHGALVVMV